MAKPLIGITLDIAIENKAHPPRDFYFLDAQNVKAMAEAGAALAMLIGLALLMAFTGIWIWSLLI